MTRTSINAIMDKLETTSRIAQSTIDALIKERDQLKAELESEKSSAYVGGKQLGVIAAEREQLRERVAALEAREELHKEKTELLKLAYNAFTRNWCIDWGAIEKVLAQEKEK